jgi:hypothetical protein
MGPELLAVLVVSAFIAVPLLMLFVFRRRLTLTERRVASLLGLKAHSRSRLSGVYQGRQVWVNRRGRGCEVTVSLSPSWRFDAAARRSWVQRDASSHCARHPECSRSWDSLFWREEGWPLADGEHFGRLALEAMLQQACIAASALDGILNEAIAEEAKRPEEFRRLGLEADGPDAWAGQVDGCDLRLERHGEACVLLAPLGPGWPQELTVELERAAKFLGRPLEGAPVEGLKAPLVAHSREPERASRLFAHAGPEFHEALQALFEGYADPSIVGSRLGLHLGPWEMRAREVQPLLAPVCRFLREVYRWTDWPEKRGAGAQGQAAQAP